MGFTHQVKYLEAAAERGHVDAQLRLGLLRRAQDGGWEAPADRSYNIKWLQKAVDQGSKSAAWELARILYPRGEISHEGFLRAAMAAAEEEGNPWAATYLMKLTSGRWGEDRKPSECTVVNTVVKKATPARQRACCRSRARPNGRASQGKAATPGRRSGCASARESEGLNAVSRRMRTPRTNGARSRLTNPAPLFKVMAISACLSPTGRSRWILQKGHIGPNAA
jgi:hypothetical protein